RRPGGVGEDLPPDTERLGREGEVNRLVPGVEEDEERVVLHRLAVPAPLRDGVTIEEDGQRLGEALLPLLVGHLVARRVEPDDVGYALAAERPALEPLAPPQNWMALAQVHQPPGEAEQGQVLIPLVPVEPRHLVV